MKSQEVFTQTIGALAIIGALFSSGIVLADGKITLSRAVQGVDAASVKSTPKNISTTENSESLQSDTEIGAYSIEDGAMSGAYGDDYSED